MEDLMRQIVKRTVLFGAMLGTTLVSARAASLDGTWMINGDVSSNPVVSTCILTTTGGKVEGTCTGTDGKLMPVEGTATDSAIKWSYESVYEGGKIVLHYDAKLKSDGTLTGTIFVDPYDADGSFTATRKAAASN
jgi:hypothetical protein